MSDQLKNPIVGTAFEIELDGITVAAFEEIDVPEQARALIQNRDGTDPNYMTLTLGNHEPVTITLRKVARELDQIVLNSFIDWRQKGGQMKKSGTITFRHPETGTPYHRVVFENAICVSVKTPAANANDNTAKATFEIKIATPRVYEVAL